MREALGLGGKLLVVPGPEFAFGGAKQLVLPAFFRPNRVLAMLALMPDILATYNSSSGIFVWTDSQ